MRCDCEGASNHHCPGKLSEASGGDGGGGEHWRKVRKDESR